MNKRIFQSIVFSLTLIMNTFSYAYTWQQQAKVTVVEATYMPNAVSFITDPLPIECANSGTWLIWPSRGNTESERIANTRSVYGALMAAQFSGNSISIYGTGCNVEFLHLLNQ